MFKKPIIVASLLGLGVALGSTAFAESNSSTYCKPGFYAGVEAGHGNTHYGYGDVLAEVKTFEDNSYTSLGVIPGTTHISDTGTSGRIFAGYQFIPYFALEAGFTQFHKTDFTQTWGHEVDSDVGFYRNATLYDGEVTQHALDVVGKFTYPLQYGFGVFAKAGLGLISADRHVNQSAVYNDGGVTPFETFYTKSYQAVRPVYGVGLDYTIPNSSLDVGLSYSQFASGGGIPRASLWALGLSEKFA